MKCKKVRKLFSRYLEKDLGPDLIKSIDVHLSKCEECSRLLNEMERTITSLHSLERATVPLNFLEEVRRKTEVSYSIKEFLLRPIFIPRPARLPIRVVTIAICVGLVYCISAITIARREYHILFTPGEKMVLLKRYRDKITEVERKHRIILMVHNIPKGIKEVEALASALEGNIIVFGENELLALGLQQDMQFKRLASLQIPKDNYPVFINKLKRVGEVVAPPKEEVTEPVMVFKRTQPPVLEEGEMLHFQLEFQTPPTAETQAK